MAEKTEDYALLESVDAAGDLTSVASLSHWRVSRARPVEGSLTERHRDEVRLYQAEEIDAAVKDFFDRIRGGLSGVLDTPEIRAWQDLTLDFCETLTCAIADDIPSIEDEDARDDDFDSHPLSALREAMVDNCPEFNGEGLDAIVSDPR